ncbi:MAG TPA: hypothetical protein VLQ65_10895 [Saliniramus sp.]|nr:hypothetical protein [Saliniramus sp.]
MSLKEAVKDKSPAPAADAAAEVAAPSNVCIIDVGTQSRKRIKKLKRGEGKLMSKIDDIVQDLIDENVVPEGAATVIVIVKQEKSIMGMFDDDDD